MAKQAPGMAEPVTAAAFGNASRVELTADLTADPQNTVIEVGEFPAGTCVDRVFIKHGALGAGTGFKLGVKYPTASDVTDVDDKFATVADSSAAGKETYEEESYKLVSRGVLILTLTGASAATGVVTTRVDYRYGGDDGTR